MRETRRLLAGERGADQRGSLDQAAPLRDTQLGRRRRHTYRVSAPLDHLEPGCHERVVLVGRRGVAELEARLGDPLDRVAEHPSAEACDPGGELLDRRQEEIAEQRASH